MELAQAIESAERDTKQLKAAQATSTPPVHYSSTKRPDHKQKGKEQSKSTKPQGSPIVCYRCDAHLATACRFISTVCHACKKRGHLARVCRSRPNLGRQAKKAHHLVETEEELEFASDEEDAYHIFAVRSKSCKPIIRTITINGVPTPMELDTGAAYSVITQKTYQRIAQQKGASDLEPSDLKLRSYSGQLLGQLPVVVTHGEKQYELYVLVVDGEGPDLLGRDWMDVTFSVGEVHIVKQGSSLQEILAKHSSLFTAVRLPLKEWK